MIKQTEFLDTDNIKKTIETINNSDDLQELVFNQRILSYAPLTFRGEYIDRHGNNLTFLDEKGIRCIAHAIQNKKIGTIQKLRIKRTDYLNASQIEILFDAFQKNDNLFELEVHTQFKNYIKSKTKNKTYYRNKLSIVQNHFKKKLMILKNKYKNQVNENTEELKELVKQIKKLRQQQHKFKNINPDAINSDTIINLEKYVSRMQNKINRLKIPQEFTEDFQFIFDLKHDLKEFEKHWNRIKKLPKEENNGVQH